MQLAVVKNINKINLLQKFYTWCQLPISRPHNSKQLGKIIFGTWQQENKVKDFNSYKYYAKGGPKKKIVLVEKVVL
jgi:hypothetical protein